MKVGMQKRGSSEAALLHNVCPKKVCCSSRFALKASIHICHSFTPPSEDAADPSAFWETESGGH